MPQKKQPPGPPPRPQPGSFLNISKKTKDVRKWGYLYQRQEAVGLWKKRFFVLSEKSLVSYAKEFDPKDPRHDPDDETSKNIRGFTDLSGASVRLVGPSDELDCVDWTVEILEVCTGDRGVFQLSTLDPSKKPKKAEKGVEKRREVISSEVLHGLISQKASITTENKKSEIKPESTANRKKQKTENIEAQSTCDPGIDHAKKLSKENSTVSLELSTDVVKIAKSPDTALMMSIDQWLADIQRAISYANEYELCEQMVPEEGLLQWYEERRKDAIEASDFFALSSSSIIVEKCCRSKGKEGQVRTRLISVCAAEEASSLARPALISTALRGKSESKNSTENTSILKWKGMPCSCYSSTALRHQPPRQVKTENNADSNGLSTLPAEGTTGNKDQVDHTVEDFMYDEEKVGSRNESGVANQASGKHVIIRSKLRFTSTSNVGNLWKNYKKSAAQTTLDLIDVRAIEKHNSFVPRAVDVKELEETVGRKEEKKMRTTLQLITGSSDIKIVYPSGEEESQFKEWINRLICVIYFLQLEALVGEKVESTKAIYEEVHEEVERDIESLAQSGKKKAQKRLDAAATATGLNNQISEGIMGSANDDKNSPASLNRGDFGDMLGSTGGKMSHFDFTTMRMNPLETTEDAHTDIGNIFGDFKFPSISF